MFVLPLQQILALLPGTRSTEGKAFCCRIRGSDPSCQVPRRFMQRGGEGACTEMPASAETPEPLVTPLSDAASPPGSMEEYFFDCRGYTILSGKLYSTTPRSPGGDRGRRALNAARMRCADALSAAELQQMNAWIDAREERIRTIMRTRRAILPAFPSASASPAACCQARTPWTTCRSSPRCRWRACTCSPTTTASGTTPPSSTPRWTTASTSSSRQQRPYFLRCHPC